MSINSYSPDFNNNLPGCEVDRRKQVSDAKNDTDKLTFAVSKEAHGKAATGVRDFNSHQDIINAGASIDDERYYDNL